MGTQAPGRKRIPNREKLTAEDDALNQIAREAEARLAAKRAARAEAREIRMKELERQQKELFHSHKEDSERYSRHSRRHTSVSDDEERMSVGSRGSLRPSDHSGFLGSSSRASSRGSSARASPVVEERPDRDYLVSQGSRSASTLSAATLASLGGALSRRGSCDTSFSVETEASIRDMKDSLAEAEEKYRKAMVSNAQLHNEKSTLMFQVETLREELGDMEELLWEARRHGDDRTKECEHERQAHSVLQFQFEEMRETLGQTEELLTEVSALRLQSKVYSQEISDLQEALQWKEKKIGALERQREISDIVRVERNRLRDEVVRLGDLLKKHGVVVFPGVTTNEGEDDVTAESVSQLAQGPSHGGRESILGKVGEWQTEEGIKLPTNHCHISKWSQSLSIISTSDQTRGDTLKQVKEAKKHTREGKEKHAGAKKQPRNKGGTRDRTNETQDANVLRNIGIKKQPVNQKCELKSALVQSIGDNQAFRGTTDSEASASHQDVFAEKIHKSRLVPPRPVKDIMLDHKALVSNIVTAGKQRCVTQEKQKQNVSGVLEKETSARDVVAQTCLSTVYQEGDGRKSRDGSCSESRVESDMSTVCSEGMKTDETVPMKDSSEGSKIAAGHVVIAKARSVSGIFEGPSVQVHPQPEDVSVDPSSSTSKVFDVQDPPAREDAENTSSSICYHEVEVAESSEDFNSYFGEPTLMELYASTNTKMSVEVISEPKERREINEMHLKPHQTSSANSYVVEQISKVRRLLRITADEIREMAVPELTVMSLQDGRIIEDRWIKESSGLNIQVHDELSVAVVDSCEEANVEVTQRPATEQQEEEKHRRGRKRFKSQCKIS